MATKSTDIYRLLGTAVDLLKLLYTLFISGTELRRYVTINSSLSINIP